MKTSAKQVGLFAVAVLSGLVVGCNPIQVRRCNSDRDCERPLICVSTICAKPAAGSDGGAVFGEDPDAGERDSGVVVEPPSEVDAGPRMACTPGSVCREKKGDCDQEEVCSADGFCPGDFVQGKNFECRGKKGDCDVAELCLGGGNKECPADVFEPTTLACRPAAGPCDIAEVCTGTSPDCPKDDFVAATVVCSDKNGVCDVEEKCTGTSAACPADAVQPNTVACYTADTSKVGFECQASSTCDGTGKTCPVKFLGSAVTCRSAPGNPTCDVAENCTGNSPACPPDGVKAANVECNPSSGSACDVPDTCDGTNRACVAKYAGPERLCGSVPSTTDLSVNCSQQQVCNSAGPNCPPGFRARPQGTTCFTGNTCLNPQTCDGSSAGCVNIQPKPTTTPCRPPANDCDVQDFCDASGNCPDSRAADGQVCSQNPQPCPAATKPPCNGTPMFPKALECLNDTASCYSGTCYRRWLCESV